MAIHQAIELDVLESRVLFSAAPVEPTPDTQVDEPAQTPADSGDVVDQGEAEAVQTGNSAPLTQETLDAVAEAAADHWRASGLTPEQVVALDALTYSIDSLDNPTLGTHGDSAIVMDDGGGGAGKNHGVLMDRDISTNLDLTSITGSVTDGDETSEDLYGDFFPEPPEEEE